MNGVPLVPGTPQSFHPARRNHAPFVTKLYPPRRYSQAPPMPLVTVLTGSSNDSAVVVSCA